MNFIVLHGHWETKQFKLWAGKKKNNDYMSMIDRLFVWLCNREGKATGGRVNGDVKQSVIEQQQ